MQSELLLRKANGLVLVAFELIVQLIVQVEFYRLDSTRSEYKSPDFNLVLKAVLRHRTLGGE